MIWTDVRVAAIDRAPDGRSVTGVTLSDGRRVGARHVVLAGRRGERPSPPP